MKSKEKKGNKSIKQDMGISGGGKPICMGPWGKFVLLCLQKHLSLWPRCLGHGMAYTWACTCKITYTSNPWGCGWLWCEEGSGKLGQEATEGELDREWALLMGLPQAWVTQQRHGWGWAEAPMQASGAMCGCHFQAEMSQEKDLSPGNKDRLRNPESGDHWCLKLAKEVNWMTCTCV